MTGSDVKQVREAMGLDPFAFAETIGVHVSSVYRWEAAKEPSIDRLQEQIIIWLSKYVKRKDEMSDLGASVRGALLGGEGTLGALHKVLHYLVAKL
jgi:DNA-binding XRE family transcriptional regulator